VQFQSFPQIAQVLAVEVHDVANFDRPDGHLLAQIFEPAGIWRMELELDVIAMLRLGKVLGDDSSFGKVIEVIFAWIDLLQFNVVLAIATSHDLNYGAEFGR
jgi:hypothetical protein